MYLAMFARCRPFDQHNRNCKFKKINYLQSFIPPKWIKLYANIHSLGNFLFKKLSSKMVVVL